MNIYEYIDRYGDKTFKEKEFNEIDNLIFSLIIYLNLGKIITEETNTLEQIGKKITEEKKFKQEFSQQKDAYKCLKQIMNTNRYKDIKLKDYVYIGTNNEQFSVVTFIINKKLIYISFEGTDHLISGWKEDFELSYMYPTASQQHAIEYLKKQIKIFGPKVIVGGHSKGGNLAQVSSMEMNIIKKLKIKKIYNNDGPGLRLEQFKSRKYKQIKKKLVHIVPHNSVFGILLRNDKYKVVVSTKKAIQSHAMSSWMVYDDYLSETDLSEKSIELEKSIIEWLNNHNEEQRKKMINNVFNIFKKCEINDTKDLRKLKSIIKIMKEVRNIDKETKELVASFINYNFF